jgi:hypothetical protein
LFLLPFPFPLHLLLGFFFGCRASAIPKAMNSCFFFF